jgi:hypothetical protein
MRFFNPKSIVHIYSSCERRLFSVYRSKYIVTRGAFIFSYCKNNIKE